MASGTAPYGGTELGIKNRFRLVREQRYAWADSEAMGRDAVRGYHGGFKASLVWTLLQADEAMLRKVYAYSTTSPNGYGDANIYTIPKAGETTLPPGVITPSSPLLFAADDPENPSTLVFAPIWTLGPKLELDKTLNKPYEHALVCVVGLDSSNRDLREALLQNLTLV